MIDLSILATSLDSTSRHDCSGLIRARLFSGGRNANDPTCQRRVGSPREGDIGLFYQGSADFDRPVAGFFLRGDLFRQDPTQVFENIEYSQVFAARRKRWRAYWS